MQAKAIDCSHAGQFQEMASGELHDIPALFQQAMAIPSLLQTVARTFAEKSDLESAYVQFAVRFWKHSETEFQYQLKLNSRRLKTVMIELPENIQRQLMDFIQLQKTEAEHRVVQCLDSNIIFNKGNNRLRLEKSSAARLVTRVGGT